MPALLDELGGGILSSKLVPIKLSKGGKFNCHVYYTTNVVLNITVFRTISSMIGSAPSQLELVTARNWSVRPGLTLALR